MRKAECQMRNEKYRNAECEMNVLGLGFKKTFRNWHSEFRI